MALFHLILSTFLLYQIIGGMRHTMVFGIELRELPLQEKKMHPAVMDLLFGTEHYQLTDMSKHGVIS